MRSLASKVAAGSFLLTAVFLSGILLIAGSDAKSLIERNLAQIFSAESQHVKTVLDRQAMSGVSFDQAVAAAAEIIGLSGHEIVLIDSSGAVVYHSGIPEDSLVFAENQLGRPEIRESLSRESSAGIEFSDLSYGDVLYGVRYVRPLLRFRNESRKVNVKFIRMSSSLAGTNAIVASERRSIFMLGAVILLLITLTSYFFTRRLTSPIIQMDSIVEEIREGNISRRIGLASRDDLGQLAIGLDSMLDKLQADIMQLKKLERYRSEFLGNVSHELRTPIFAMQGLLETLLHGGIDDPKVNKDFLQKALKNTDRLNVLLGDLIDISRIESGEMKLSFRYFDLGGLLASTVAELSPAAEHKKIHLRLDADATQGTEVYGDRDRLRQVIINLVDNAIKYSENGGTVVISTTEMENHVEVSIADSGIGIPEEHLPRIFERFYRVDKDRSREEGGTGLGLAIVKHILEAHHSSITVRSEVGKGSNFTFNVKK